MKQHLYNSKLSKVRWFVRRFGIKELFFKPLRMLFAPLIVPLLGRRAFEYNGRKLNYFYHPYNMTWATERCVEIPIGRDYVRSFQGRRILEIGNVLSHYGEVQHDVLDKFEKGKNVINEDIVEFKPSQKYDLVLSISTFEHIGFDDESPLASSGEKILSAIHVSRQMLNPDGTLILTVPIGYNPELDALISKNALAASEEHFVQRVNRREWKAVDKAKAMSCRYGHPFPYANAICIAHFLPYPERT